MHMRGFVRGRGGKGKGRGKGGERREWKGREGKRGPPINAELLGILTVVLMKTASLYCSLLSITEVKWSRSRAVRCGGWAVASWKSSPHVHARPWVCLARNRDKAGCLSSVLSSHTSCFQFFPAAHVRSCSTQHVWQSYTRCVWGRLYSFWLNEKHQSMQS